MVDLFSLYYKIFTCVFIHTRGRINSYMIIGFRDGFVSTFCRTAWVQIKIVFVVIIYSIFAQVKGHKIIYKIVMRSLQCHLWWRWWDKLLDDFFSKNMSYLFDHIEIYLFWNKCCRYHHVSTHTSKGSYYYWYCMYYLYVSVLFVILFCSCI